MGTTEIKQELAVRYPGIKFVRRSKAKDRLGYTHRVFESPTKIAVVTCDAYEDYEIMEVNEVIAVPQLPDFKDYLRPWNPAGPLCNYYFAFGPISDATNSPILIVADKTIWNNAGYVSDSGLQDPLIQGLLGVSCLMEAVYETSFGQMSEDTITLLSQFEVSNNEDGSCGDVDGWYPPKPKIGSEDDLRKLAISLGATEKTEIAGDFSL